MNSRVLSGVCAAVISSLAAAPLLAADAPVQRKTITFCGNTLQLMTPEEVKALGFPWTDVADDENAAMFYIQGANALHELKADPEAEKQRQHIETNVWDDGLKELAAFLDAAKPALDFYRQGSTRKACQLPLQKTGMLASMLLPDLGKARQAARLLVADARRLESQRKFKEAVDDYVAVLRIGAHYGSSGRTLIDQLVGIAVMQIGGQGAFCGFYRQAYPKDELKRFLAEIEPLRARLPDYAHAMRCERAFGLGTMDDIMRLGPGGLGVIGGGFGPPDETASPLQQRLFRIVMPDRTMKKDMAGFYDRAIAAAGKPFAPGKADEDLLRECKPWNFFAQMFLPAFGRCRIHSEQARASYEMLRVAVALKLYRDETGVYPDELGWLVKDKYLAAVPNDPFSGKPLLYRVADGEFVLYSVNDNLKDDGGKFGPQDNQADLGVTSKLAAVKAYGKKDEK